MQNVFPKMSKTQGEIRWPGNTTLGAHNKEVYGGELGISDDELARMKEDAII
jgi:formyl-CoA transferase/succinyl-CoA--D-citramalate CoA-transferase